MSDKIENDHSYVSKESIRSNFVTNLIPIPLSVIKIILVFLIKEMVIYFFHSFKSLNEQQ